MNEQTKAVTEAFVRLHKEGLIYEEIGLFIVAVNFSETALSDRKVDHIDIKRRTPTKVPGVIRNM